MALFESSISYVPGVNLAGWLGFVMMKTPAISRMIMNTIIRYFFFMLHTPNSAMTVFCNVVKALSYSVSRKQASGQFP